MFGGNFAPAGWAFCDGQLMPISENDTLFNLIGTTYGGDGQRRSPSPNLQGRIPIHAGTGPGGVTRQLGETDGIESVTLSVKQIPAHSPPHAGLDRVPAPSPTRAASPRQLAPVSDCLPLSGCSPDEPAFPRRRSRRRRATSRTTTCIHSCA